MRLGETDLDGLMARVTGAGRAERCEAVDYVSRDGKEAYELRLNRQGVRDVRDGMLQLAGYLNSGGKKVRRGYLLISVSRSSPQRILEEWNVGKAVMLPKVAKKLCLLAVVEGKTVIEPSERRLLKMAEAFREAASDQKDSGDAVWSAAPARQSPNSWKHLEVEKVLLHRWLLKEGPIAIGQLQKMVGCSYPTVASALEPLAEEGLIRRGSERSVELLKYPRSRWAAVIASARSVYQPLEFVDVTGEPGSPEGLLKRLQKLRNLDSMGLAVGGVIAARRWDKDFDLNGTPRLDLVVHAPIKRHWKANIDLDFVRQIDPALVLRAGPHVHRSPVLVVHRIHRHASLFAQGKKDLLPWAYPVETIFHLNEMGLTAQANDLVSRLRPELGMER